MHAGELSEHGHWSIALVFYRRDRAEDLHDENGDAVIRGFLHPLVQALDARTLLSHFNWIRYSENGFHIRCRFWATSEAMGIAQRELIASSFGAFKREHPQLFDGEATLSGAARALNEKLPGYALRQPGTLELGPVAEAGEGSVYDTWEAYEFSQIAHTHLARMCLDSVAMRTPYARNLALAQIIGFDLLDCIATCRSHFSELAAFVCATWRDFFDISAREGAIDVAHVWKRKHAFGQLFDRKRGTQDSLMLVPPELHSQYRAHFDWLHAQPLGRLHAQPAQVFAMQVLALFHQQFNRLGISIKDETAYADLLAGYGAGGVDAFDPASAGERVASWVEYWSQNRVEV